MAFSFSDCPTLSDYIQRYQVDAIMWKADRLLAGADTPLVKDERSRELARTISLIPEEYQVMRDEYIVKIAKAYSLQRKTFERFVNDQLEITRRHPGRSPRKNKVVTLDGNPKTFPFFVETKDQDGNFKGVRIDKVRFVVMVYPLDKWVLMMIEAGAEIRNLKDVKWLATEDGSAGKGTGRHIACFILDPNKKKP